jgi:hypothetical protein
LSAAEAGAEALQLQVISQDRLMARLQDQWRTDSQAMREHTEALLKRVELLGDELRQLGIENERKRIEIERLVNASAGLQAELSRVQNAMVHNQQEFNAAISQNQAKLSQTQVELSQTQVELSQTQVELAQLQDERQIMLNSNSWRITKPLRWFVRLFSSNRS